MAAISCTKRSTSSGGDFSKEGLGIHAIPIEQLQRRDQFLDAGRGDGVENQLQMSDAGPGEGAEGIRQLLRGSAQRWGPAVVGVAQAAGSAGAFEEHED